MRSARSFGFNPMSHILVAYQQILFDGDFHHWEGLGARGPGGPRDLRPRRLPLRAPPRHPGGGSVSGPPAIVAQGLTKIYRRFLHQNQFKTLKSALLTGSLLSDLRADETFTALEGVSFDVPKGSTFGVIGANGSGKSTLLKLLAGITKPTRGTLTVQGRISALIELGAGLPSRDQRSRERLHQRHHARPQPARDRRPLRRDRGVRRDAALHRRPREDLLLGHVHAPRLLRGHTRGA